MRLLLVFLLSVLPIFPLRSENPEPENDWCSGCVELWKNSPSDDGEIIQSAKTLGFNASIVGGTAGRMQGFAS